jgi:hypothetical protein
MILCALTGVAAARACVRQPAARPGQNGAGTRKVVLPVGNVFRAQTNPCRHHARHHDADLRRDGRRAGTFVLPSEPRSGPEVPPDHRCCFRPARRPHAVHRFRTWDRGCALRERDHDPAHSAGQSLLVSPTNRRLDSGAQSCGLSLPTFTRERIGIMPAHRIGWPSTRRAFVGYRGIRLPIPGKRGGTRVPNGLPAPSPPKSDPCGARPRAGPVDRTTNV